MANRTYTSAFSALRATMEVCSEKVSEAYSKPLTEIDIYTGELPPGHRPTDRRQRYYVTEHEGDMIVALPGTTHPLDWSSNLRVNYTPVDGSSAASGLEDLEEVPCAHAGFYFRSETVPSVQLLQLAADKGCRLVFTGHSLGGAVANLCALAALNAQKRQLTTAAASKGVTDAAGAAKCSSNDATICEVGTHVPVNKSAQCSGSRNDDSRISPQAALVEVLAISFASPIFANAALAQFIEANGWEECFVNLVIPEDYCLNLFNNVLTSAPQCEGKSLSRSTGSRFKATKKQTLYSEPQEPSEDPIPEAPIDAAALPLAVAGSSRTASTIMSASSSSRSSSSKANTGVPQQPLVSAMAGKSPSKMRSKRQLCFAEPLLQEQAGGSPAHAAVVASETAAASSWNEAKCLPRSTSTASLLSEGSSSSTRSWTLMAYLPGSITRSISSWSGSGTSSMRNSSSSGSTSSSTNSCSDLLDEHFDGWGMRHDCSTADTSYEVGSSSSSSIDSGDTRVDGFLDALAAPFVSHTNSLSTKGNQHAPEDLDHVSGSAGSAALDGLPAKAWHKRLLHSLQADRKAVLRKSFSSASLKLLKHSPSRLLQPLSLLRGTDRWSLVTNLLPSMRSVVIASRAVANAAHKVGEKAFNVPLGALEAGLIKALKPPMYEAVGQQWILSATGLVPQHQPIHQYPKHVSDVYWHKELMLVAFKEHSIVFYKRRLLQQASRR